MSDFINKFFNCLKKYAYFLCVCPKKRLLSYGSLNSHFAKSVSNLSCMEGLEIH